MWRDRNASTAYLLQRVNSRHGEWVCCRRIPLALLTIAAVSQPEAHRPPKKEFSPASSSMWKGWGS
jgi:hypothetical protein